jgi:hypothetical protein
MRSRLVRAVVLMTLAGTARASATHGATDEKAKCCFNNPQYSGVCQVEPAAGETCAGILDYLNHPGSTGKTYCNNTDIRGGWKRLSCKAGS